jgi:hypothetical protein
LLDSNQILDPQKYSQFDEKELLFAPGSIFKVMAFIKDLNKKKFIITIEPVPYKLLERDPLADLPLSQKSLID